MNLSAQEINAQFLMLPEPEQQKVIDFICNYSDPHIINHKAA